MGIARVDSEIDAIHAVLQSWIESMEGRDITGLAEVVSPEPSLVWIGAGAEDWLCGYQALEKALEAQNNKYKDIDVKASDETIHWSPGQRASWVTNRWIFKATVADQAIALPLRCTWILVKGEAGWKIVHFHKSVGLVG